MTRILALVAVIAVIFGGAVLWGARTQHRADVAEARAEDAEGQALGHKTQAELNAGTIVRTAELAERDTTISEGVHREQERVRLALTQDGGVERAVSAWAVGIDRLRDAGPDAGDRVADGGDPRDGERAVLSDRASGDSGDGNVGRASLGGRSRRDVRRARGRLSRALGRLHGARPVDRRAVIVFARTGRRSSAVRSYTSSGSRDHR